MFGLISPEFLLASISRASWPEATGRNRKCFTFAESPVWSSPDSPPPVRVSAACAPKARPHCRCEDPAPGRPAATSGEFLRPPQPEEFFSPFAERELCSDSSAEPGFQLGQVRAAALGRRSDVAGGDGVEQAGVGVVVGVAAEGAA